MGNYLVMKKFKRESSIEDVAEKLKSMFSICEEFINYENVEELCYIDEDSNTPKKYDSLFDFAFDDYFKEKVSGISFDDIEFAIHHINDYLQECREDFSDLVCTRIEEEDSMIIAMAIIVHSI